MKGEVIIEKFSHYDMGERQGLKVEIRGEVVNTNNETGVQIMEAPVLNYAELKYLKTIPADSFPAKFNCNMDLTKVKNKNGQDVTGLALSDLKFLCSMKLVEVKTA